MHPTNVLSLHRQGTQGILDGASKGTLEDQFGTSRDEEVVTQILEQGSIVESEVSS
jgi:ribosome maturation protein Sdo1